MGVVTGMIRILLALGRFKRASRKAGKVFRIALIEQGVDEKVAARLSKEFESMSEISFTSFIRNGDPGRSPRSGRLDRGSKISKRSDSLHLNFL
jgi:hypothetical protein